jgi:hypothetical protein
MENNWLRRPRTWIEVFVLCNLGGLAPDIFLAHSVNAFHSRAEYTPLIFSLVAPALLLPALWALATGRLTLWRGLGFIVGGTAVLIGITGLVLHLQSQFFQQWTLASLVYAAPFAAPLAYTGLGSLLLMNRMVADEATEWAQWVIFFRSAASQEILFSASPITRKMDFSTARNGFPSSAARWPWVF